MVQLSHSCMTSGKTIALTIWTFVRKVMSPLFNMLSRFIIVFLPGGKSLLISWLQSPSAVILEPKKVKSVTVSTFSPFYLPWSDGTRCHDLIFFSSQTRDQTHVPYIRRQIFFFFFNLLFIYLFYNSGSRWDRLFQTFYLLCLERFPPHFIFFYTSMFDSLQGFCHPSVGGFIWLLFNWCVASAVTSALSHAPVL